MRGFLSSLGRSLLIVMLAVGLTVVFSGCEEDVQPNVRQGQAALQANGPSDPEHSSVERTITLGFSQLGSESDWRRANTQSIQRAAEEAGIRLEFANAEQSQEKQFEAVRSFIRNKVDVIAIAPVVKHGWEPILREVKAAGIPVMIIDRLIDVEDTSLYLTFIGSDFYEEGQRAGKYVLDKLADSRGPVGIVELKGTEGSAPSIDRGRGFRDVIRKRADMHIIESAYGDFTYDQGKQIMQEFLNKQGRHIQVLFAHNDDMALGALEAIEAHGLQPGRDIVIVSVDGTKRALEELNRGRINSVVECNPLLGPGLMQAIRELYDGRTLPKRIITPEGIFTEVTAEKEVQNRLY